MIAHSFPFAGPLSSRNTVKYGTSPNGVGTTIRALTTHLGRKAVAPMSIPRHTPLADEEAQMLDTDIALTRGMEAAVEQRDIDLLADLMAEKLSIERAFQSSRSDTFTAHMAREFGGAA